MPEVLHLHHLTPIHEAAARELPDLPVVTHLHGTELKMIDRVEPRREGSGTASTPPTGSPRCAGGRAPATG